MHCFANRTPADHLLLLPLIPAIAIAIAARQTDNNELVSSQQSVLGSSSSDRTTTPRLALAYISLPVSLIYWLAAFSAVRCDQREEKESANDGSVSQLLRTRQFDRAAGERERERGKLPVIFFISDTGSRIWEKRNFNILMMLAILAKCMEKFRGG
jgi:hypothetical protein